MTLHKRGMYFDGSKYLTVENLCLNTVFTIQAWIRVDGNSNIFSISRTGVDTEGEEQFLNFGDTGNNLNFYYHDGT